MEENKIREILSNGSFGVVFPKGKKTEEAAMKLAESIEDVRAVASFNNEKGDIGYGVVIKWTSISDAVEEEVNDKM